jgi:hypothetical protein
MSATPARSTIAVRSLPFLLESSAHVVMPNDRGLADAIDDAVALQAAVDRAVGAIQNFNRRIEIDEKVSLE